MIPRVRDSYGALGVRGFVRWWVRRPNGTVESGGRRNLVVTSARGYLADLCRGVTASRPWGAMAIGSDSPEPSMGDVKLVLELARLPLPAPDTDSDLQKNILVAGNIVTLRQTFTGLVGVVVEYGTFGDIVSPPGAPNSGRLFNRAVIDPVSLTEPDLFTVECELTFS